MLVRRARATFDPSVIVRSRARFTTGFNGENTAGGRGEKISGRGEEARETKNRKEETGRWLISGGVLFNYQRSRRKEAGCTFGPRLTLTVASLRVTSVVLHRDITTVHGTWIRI